MARRRSSRCVHVGDVFVLENRAADTVRRVGEVVDVPGDVEHESYRVLWEDDGAALFHPPPTDASIEAHRKARAGLRPSAEKEVAEPDYEGSVLVHEP